MKRNPCPFCGSDHIMVEGHKPVRMWLVAATCQDCFVRGPEIHAKKHNFVKFRKDAISLWNKRAKDSPMFG